MISPKKQRDVVFAPGSTVHWSVPDVYSARAGAAVSVLSNQRLSLSLGGRIDGIPVHDLFGGGDDNTIKRTSHVVFADPGLSIVTGRGTFTLRTPIRVFRAHANVGLQVLAVNGRDQETSNNAVQKFVDRYAVPFSVVLDERGVMRQSLKLGGLPTTVFDDTAGVVRRIKVGPTSAEELAAGVSLILPRR